MVKFKMYFLKKSKCILKKERENKIKEERKKKGLQKSSKQQIVNKNIYTNN